MGLRITRAVNTLMYGGFDLDGSRLDETYAHRIWFRGFTGSQKGETGTALLSVNTPKLSRDYSLTVGSRSESIRLDDDVQLTFLGVRLQDIEMRQKCPECGNTWHEISKRVQGRFDIDAPKNYKILRDDVSKNYAKKYSDLD